MSYYHPKYKICKQVGEDIWNVGSLKKTKYANYSFQKIKKSKLFYKLFRQEKILRAYYGNLTRKQYQNIFKLTYKNALYKQNPILYLESRLDMFLTRVKWVNSIAEAKQFILHGNILINGRVITFAAYKLQPGDIVQVRQSKIEYISAKVQKHIDTFKQGLSTVSIPDYIHVNYNIMSAILLNIPTLKQIPYLVKLNPYMMKQYYQL